MLRKVRYGSSLIVLPLDFFFFFFTAFRLRIYKSTIMAAMGRLGFLATAVIFHLVYIYSIFDIYFVSPIVSGMQLVPVDRPANTKSPANRLVLFVGTTTMRLSMLYIGPFGA